MFKPTQVGAAAAMAIGAVTGLLPTHVAAQETQRIEITGSSIKRLNAEGPAPIEIYTRKDIQRTGATTLSELVKNIASIDIDDQGELTGNSPAGSGTANLQIRGLSSRNVLVLLNGRRLPTNALTDGSGAGAAVDVNNIPVSALERVEVLKDGGSAIYGSDAVAGVINFITRKNYNGIEVQTGFGRSSRGDSNEKSGGLVAGFGDYDKSGFNLLAALDVFKRDPLLRTARDITRSADLRLFDGVTDGRSVFHPNGNILDPTGRRVIGQVVPCPPEDLSGLTCRFDFNKSILTSVNGADRWSSMLIGNVRLGDTRAFTELVYSESKDLFEAQPAPGNFTDALGRTVRGRLMQVGPRTTNRTASLLSATVGLEGSFRGMDWDIAIGQGISKVDNQEKNFLNRTLFEAAIANGTIDPTSNNNPVAVLDALRLTPNRNGRSVNQFVNAKTSGSWMKLGGGDLGYAIGLQLNKESLRDTPDANQVAGNVFGSIAQASVDASRDLKAVFAELAIPLYKNFEAQLAVRSDHYSGTTGNSGGAPVNGKSASKTSPKVALKYSPTDRFAVRASYAGSFLAPSLKQLFGGQEEGADSTSDKAIICPAFGIPAADCNNFPFISVSGGNPNLQPETGKTFNVGFVFEPAPAVSMAVDVWQIKKSNEVGTPETVQAVQRGFFRRRASGEFEVFTTNQNVAATETSGVDVDLRVRLGDTPLGKLSVRDNGTYYSAIRRQTDPGDPMLEFAGTFATPRWRNTLSFTLDSGAWSSSLTVRTTAGMRDTNQEVGSTAYNGARDIGTHEEIDLGVQYTGVNNLTLNGYIKNLRDRAVPFSQTGTLNQFGALGFPFIYSPRGRFFQVSANYKFN
jgi:iron complex outermembrane recepter protein